MLNNPVLLFSFHLSPQMEHIWYKTLTFAFAILYFYAFFPSTLGSSVLDSLINHRGYSCTNGSPAHVLSSGPWICRCDTFTARQVLVEAVNNRRATFALVLTASVPILIIFRRETPNLHVRKLYWLWLFFTGLVASWVFHFAVARASDFLVSSSSHGRSLIILWRVFASLLPTV